MTADEFVNRFGWGHLKDHFQECSDCGGSGLDDEDKEADNCHLCDGDGQFRWGSFYENDTGLCYTCKKPDVKIAQMYEWTGGPDEGYVCLPCYIKSHRNVCGCDLWVKAEKACPT